VLVGLASDTHGNVAALERALALFQRAQVERVLFLGGRAGDVDAALARCAGGSWGGRIVRVASRACPEYESGKVPRMQIDLLEGRVCCLVHDKADLTRDDIENASVIFHGNSAAAALVQIGPRCFVTPGHLRAPPPEGHPATFALVEVTPREVVLTVFSDACAELRQERTVAGPAGKLSVR
jgi:predicted phosphodiesterase